jgi:molybdate transport system substrate-binding protein
MGYEHWSKTMKTMPFACRAAAFALISILPMAGTARGEDLRVMASGAFTEAYHHLTPEFERSNHIKIFTAYGASMGGAPDSIPSRLQRGEPADLVILAAPALEDLIKQGKIVAGSRVDLARSSIGVAVRAGASKPDISTMEALKNTLLRAKSIAYSSSASGAYLSHELFPRLGIADQIASKCIQVPSGPVGVVVARGDAELGLQQISELLPVPGLTYVGPLPAEAQKVTVFSAGIATAAKDPKAARALIQFLASPAVRPVIQKTGLDPVN